MVAKKIAISNPRSKEDCSDNLIPFEDMLRENKVHCVNKLIAGRTGKEYYNDNKETYIKYREDNKDKIKEFCWRPQIS